MSAVITIRLAVEMVEAPGKGWIARLPEISATAQGDTQAEAVANLKALVEGYPEVLEPVIAKAGKTPNLELVPA
ncbi:MAG: hypothetical protein M3024_14350 [Candidatus Dormibacteraeota bacterium]|nr:hypothetical protein [Candidatus Dormibacteraeota bacterium]